MAVARTKAGQAPDGAGLGHVGMQQTGAGLTQQRPDGDQGAEVRAGLIGRTSGTRRTGTEGSDSSPSSGPGRPVARTTGSSWPRDLARSRTWRAGPPMFMRVVKSRTDPPGPLPPGSRRCRVAPLALLTGPIGTSASRDRVFHLPSPLASRSYGRRRGTGSDRWGGASRSGWALRRTGGWRGCGLPCRCVALF
jgi:hypothetical protein